MNHNTKGLDHGSSCDGIRICRTRFFGNCDCRFVGSIKDGASVGVAIGVRIEHRAMRACARHLARLGQSIARPIRGRIGRTRCATSSRGTQTRLPEPRPGSRVSASLFGIGSNRRRAGGTADSTGTGQSVRPPGGIVLGVSATASERLAQAGARQTSPTVRYRGTGKLEKNSPSDSRHSTKAGRRKSRSG